MHPETVSRSKLDGRIDSFLVKRLDKSVDRFELQRLVPTPTWNRFDLGFKLLFLDAVRSHETDFAKRIYAEHIKAFSLGDMAEPGNDQKTGIESFCTDFTDIFERMGRKGFDPVLSLLPLAEDGSPINGGHRTACAMTLNVPVTAVRTRLEPVCFDHRFFELRGIDTHDLDAAATRLIEAMPNAAVALLWPAAKGKLRKVENIIGPLVYRRAVTLSLDGGHNLLTRVYANEPWLGDPSKNYPGVRRKLMECFSGTDDLRVLVFDAPPAVDRVALKDRIRQVYGIAKSSVHMTDTHAEAIEMARMLLNANSRHFLDHARPMEFAQTRERIAELHTYLVENRVSPQAVAADTGMVMGAYGLRAPNDIDVIADGPLPSGPVEQHDDRYRDLAPSEMLQDPFHHFFFQNIKFVSLTNVANLKSRRLAGRDREDLLLMQPLLAPQATRPSSHSLSTQLQFAHLRFRRRAIKFLFALGVGHATRRLYRRAKRR